MEDYFRVNIERKLLIKIPKQEDHDLTPATRLLERKREMIEVDTSLLKQKEEFQTKMESLSQRREELARKETQLKESLLKFDKFLNENDAKRIRALKKAIEEKKIRDQKDVEIQDLKQSQETFLQKKERQASAIQINSSYHKYLESLLESGSEFTEVRDIISRFDTLFAANQELLDRARQAQEKSESDRIAFVTATEEKNNMILNYNNQIAKLQTKLEESRFYTAKYQSELDLILKTQSQKSLLLGQVKMATNNLFVIVKNHLNNKLQVNGTLAQLDKIGQFIVDLSSITQLDQES